MRTSKETVLLHACTDSVDMCCLDSLGNCVYGVSLANWQWKKTKFLYFLPATNAGLLNHVSIFVKNTFVVIHGLCVS